MYSAFLALNILQKNTIYQGSQCSMNVELGYESHKFTNIFGKPMYETSHALDLPIMYEFHI
jgi:hypothetical protein